ncbi:hypothetical protein AVEN_262179-1 [Araneus ventricosus]|uniref:Uncharacterized protein n=1 Tax=Araneus ventricosus TaxID=182803 RepID=A0A4Y2S8H9_ARAVE|nr:hypothetical protein AVEN_262179-1 [Araneus ventricosus]
MTKTAPELASALQPCSLKQREDVWPLVGKLNTFRDIHKKTKMGDEIQDGDVELHPRIGDFYYVQQDSPESISTNLKTIFFWYFEMRFAFERRGIEDLERSVVLIKPSLELEPTTFSDTSANQLHKSFHCLGVTWELVEVPLNRCST